MLLTHRIHPHPSSSSAQEDIDIFSSSLALLFPNDAPNQHGDPGTGILYRSPRFGDLDIRLPVPAGAQSRGLFAQYVWNAGVWLAAFVEDEGKGAGGWYVRRRRRRDRRGVEPEPETRPHESDGMGKVASVEKAGEQDSDDDNHDDNGGVHQSGGEDVFCVAHKRVLELGAGNGLSGIVCALAGAAKVTITDYPAPEILANIKANVDRNVSAVAREGMVLGDVDVEVRGHCWGEFGDSVTPTEEKEEKDERQQRTETQTAPPPPTTTTTPTTTITTPKQPHPPPETQPTPIPLLPPSPPTQPYDIIYATDVLWQPPTHALLLRSISHYLSFSAEARAVIIAGFHTGRDVVAAFLRTAEEMEMVGGDDGDGKGEEARGGRSGGRSGGRNGSGPIFSIERLWEQAVDGRRRAWRAEREGEGGKEGARAWCVVCVLKRR
ncbi:MAG: hypothetical protein M1819_003895 [Sarea resinae]|nr:MAG: hypothetical protein M1819_003895 [Sarea resinae]